MDSPTGNSQFSATALLARSETLGSYRIVESRGFVATDFDSRGFTVPAALFDATDLQSGAPVVLKVFRRSFDPDDSFARRFLRDGSRIARFSHPNVASVYEVGLERGLLFAATQPLDGERLSDWALTSGLSADETSTSSHRWPMRSMPPIRTGSSTETSAPRRSGSAGMGCRSSARLRSSGGRSRISISGTPEDYSFSAPELLAGSQPTAATDVYALTGVLVLLPDGINPIEPDGRG